MAEGRYGPKGITLGGGHGEETGPIGRGERPFSRDGFASRRSRLISARCGAGVFGNGTPLCGIRLAYSRSRETPRFPNPLAPLAPPGESCVGLFLLARGGSSYHVPP
jgi:hypothetical protein